MNNTKVGLLRSLESDNNFTPKDHVPNNVSSIGAKNFWEKGYTGCNVVVAILDTGCNTEHLDLKERIIGGYNFTNEFDGDVNNYEDLNGHGTHAAGIIAASKNNLGIVGVAPEVSLLILKVLDYRGSGSAEALVKAIEYATKWTGPNNQRVNILSLSLGLSSAKENLHNAIKKAIAKNIAVVVASGNNGDGELSTEEYSYPAGYEEVIAVGAIDSNMAVANFSNTNKEVDIYAPGVNIKSTFINDHYVNLTGTSMAAPHVSGALALLINKYEILNNLKPTESKLFKYLMQHTTKIQNSEYQETLSVLNLSLEIDMKDNFNDQYETTTLDKSLLLKCFCETRKSQAFFTQCLNEHSTEQERKFLISLIQESASTANYIKNLCETF